jgi:hypothetical protein
VVKRRERVKLSWLKGGEGLKHSGLKGGRRRSYCRR